MYVPEKRTLQLVEMLDSVLPEDEWLIGISDLTHFRGVGFSMPVSFAEFRSLERQPLLAPDEGGCEIEMEPIGEVTDSQLPFLRGPILTTDLECDQIQPSETHKEDGLYLIGPDELQLSQTIKLDIEPVNLYAFLPGLFYCSNQESSVDAVLIEVTQRDMLGMTLTSFRPENVRTLDVAKELIKDDKGKSTSLLVSQAPLVRSNTSSIHQRASTGKEEASKPTQQKNPTHPLEIDFALHLAETLALKELKGAYLSGTVFSNRLTGLVDDIEHNGLKPRYRIYVRNRKYPDGKVIEARYRTLDNVLRLDSGSGLECPEDIDVSLELSVLSFSSLGAVNKEVGVEEAILESYEFMLSEFGDIISKERIMEFIVPGAGN